ncbi:MAG: GFA family protein [Gammaproteobacteria bacterium]|nr:GFA family protein [Gammaproteobacteria bacterium]
MQGSCLCGKIVYEADEFAAPIVHCHCRKCRKAHGSAFATTAPVLREHFRWLQGEDLLSFFESSPGKRRHFCSSCGSQLIAEWVDKPTVIIRMGCLDSEPGSKPQAHIWRSEGASWYDPGDDLPQLQEGRTR